MANQVKINLNTGRPQPTQTHKAVKAISNKTGMKPIAVARTAATGVNKGYTSPAYKDQVSSLAEGYKGTEKKITETLRVARKQDAKKRK